MDHFEETYYKQLDKLLQQKEIQKIQDVLEYLHETNDVKKLKDFSMGQILCSFLFHDEQDQIFADLFVESIEKLMEQRGIHDDYETFLMQEYDAKLFGNRDFSLEKFNLNVSKNNICNELEKFIPTYQKNQFKRCFLNLILLWMKQDKEKLTIYYTNYFESFYCIFEILDILSHEVVIRMHEQCIVHIFDKISELNEKSIASKYDVYLEYDCDDDDDRFDEMKDSICEEVEKWNGRFPFSGLLDGVSSVEETLKCMKTHMDNQLN